MVELEIPIAEFLDRAIVASASSDFLAFITVVARTADAEFLQNELLRHWESFDDLTGDQILVLSPSSDGDHNYASVPHGREAQGLINRRLRFGSRPSTDWQDEFWRARPSNPKSEPRFYESLGARHSPRRPPNEAEKKAALTATAGETSRYFGIPEGWLPCVVVLSIPDKTLLVISVDEWFSLYAMVRTALIDYEPVVSSREKLKRRATELSWERRRKEEEIAKARSILRATESTDAHVAGSWMEQIQAASRMLKAVADYSSECRVFANFLLDWFQDKVETPTDFESRWQSWLTPIANQTIRACY
jgi:hypothetical protein